MAGSPHAPPNATGEWGNQFHITGAVGRAQAIDEFRAKLIADPRKVARVRKELAGKRLGCFCAPRACHGHVLYAVANASREELGLQPFEESPRALNRALNSAWIDAVLPPGGPSTM